MLFLDSGDPVEQLRDMFKTFLAGFLGKGGVHIGPLVVFALGRVLQVRSGIRDAVVQQLEPDFRVLLLVVGRLQKQRRDLLIALFLGFGCIVRIFVARLAFAGKSRHQVGFGFGAFQIAHGFSPPLFLAAPFGLLLYKSYRICPGQ